MCNHLGATSVSWLGAKGNEGVKPYYKRYLGPLIDAPIDDGMMAVYLNEEIDAWERARDGIGDPLWPKYVDLLHTLLAALRVKIRDRIVAAEVVLGVVH